MPIYDYKCSKCGDGFEILQGLYDKMLNHCLKCNDETLSRVISGNQHFILKGAGFYKPSTGDE